MIGYTVRWFGSLATLLAFEWTSPFGPHPVFWVHLVSIVLLSFMTQQWRFEGATLWWRAIKTPTST